ncbi:MAG: DUF3604 domain-containing protein [Myxococcales bacterium]|nr:DUF3604 domain-containing protein [Myxococcales bacterium]
MLKKILIAFVVAVLALVSFVYFAGKGGLGEHEGPGETTASLRPPAGVEREKSAIHTAAERIGVPRPKQVLFGDFHVHTTFSPDAFMLSLPASVGEGAHPPADACDFARFCSALDFWSINDHAEGISPRHWQETVDSIRQCNALAGDSASPDSVAFLGWEWTQVGTEPSNHYGHKNVVLRHTDAGNVPPRPIAAGGRVASIFRAADRPFGLGAASLLAGDDRFHDLARYIAERVDLERCPDDVPTTELPTDCQEFADTPADLFRKLDEGGHESIVIPHGTTWGFYTPPGSEWDKQLVGDMHDADRQTMIEVYSGHGNSEEYRDFRGVELAADGSARCPEPRANYLPTCWRAGEIIRARCLEAGESDDACESRAADARANAAAAGQLAHLTVPGVSAAEWLDAGQCRDCAQASFNHRPGGSAQYILAIGNFDAPEPRHFRMAFMASSDNHFARPGTGFKEKNRLGNTESGRPLQVDSPLASFVAPPPQEPVPESRPIDPENPPTGFGGSELERQTSFFMTGGLIAVHAEGRDRDAIWGALDRREVYGTSGPRILLWFDLLNPPGSLGAVAPMGSEVTMTDDPIFQVRAVGSRVQLPGCPDYAESALGPDRLEALCKGECFHPSDARRPITHIDIVRIRPQQTPDEPLADLIEDPWRTFPCEPGPSGCAVTFGDPEFASSARGAVYYARAHEAPAPAINADGVRCSDSECQAVSLCGPDPADDCLGEHEPRAWSSPIWVDAPGASAGS